MILTLILKDIQILNNKNVADGGFRNGSFFKFLNTKTNIRNNSIFYFKSKL